MRYDGSTSLQGISTFLAPRGGDWQTHGSIGFRFERPAQLPDALVTVDLRAKMDRATVMVKERGAGVVMPVQPLVPTVHVQLSRSNAPGTC